MFQIHITCIVKQIKIAFSGIDCGSHISYGPYIGNIHLVEMFANEEQSCHLPFIQRTTVNGKCEVTVDYPNDRSEVVLQAKLEGNENTVITVCMDDITFSCE